MPIRSSKAGFTLVELMVVIVIISLSFVMLVRLKRQSTLDEAANQVLADVRNMQFKAISGARYDIDGDGTLDFVCGFGIAKVNAGGNKTDYLLYVETAKSGSCNFGSGGVDTRYNTGGGSDADVVIEVKSIDLSLEFEEELLNFKDILFVPPDAKAYINNDDPDPGNPPEEIIIKRGSNCGSDICKTICVYNYGKIEVVDGGAGNC